MKKDEPPPSYRERTNRTQHLEIPFSGISMTPFLRPGDSLLVDVFENPIRADRLSPGDVVLFRDEDQWVTHRILAKDGRFFTKGDHNLNFEENPHVWGRVTGYRRNQQGKRKSVVWGERLPPFYKTYSYLSELFSTRTPRFIRWVARTALVFLNPFAMSNPLLSRRWDQFFQILRSPTFRSRESIQQAIRERYDSANEVNLAALTLSLEPEESNALETILPKVPREKLLVVGCGAGRELFELAPLFQEAVGTELSENMLLRARLRLCEKEPQLLSRVHFFQGPISVGHGPFDLVFVSRWISNFIPGQTGRKEFWMKIKSNLSLRGAAVYEPALGKPRFQKRLASIALRLRWIFNKNISWEPGDSVLSFLGNHNDSNKLLFFHSYPTEAHFLRELGAVGLTGKKTQTTIWEIRHETVRDS